MLKFETSNQVKTEISHHFKHAHPYLEKDTQEKPELCIQGYPSDFLREMGYRGLT